VCFKSAVNFILLIFFYADYYQVQDIELFKYQLLQMYNGWVVVSFVAFDEVKIVTYYEGVTHN